MPGAELDLPGPRYEPMSGSVGEPAGTKLAPPTLSPSSDFSPSSSVPSVDPDLSHSDSDSDSDSEPDADDDLYVPDPVPDLAGSPPASPASPSPSPEPRAESPPEPEQSASPEPVSDSRDSRTPPALGQPYVTRSGRSIRPTGEWWKVNHPYQNARDHR